ncbi:MAG: hypothetical protein JXA28_13265 [Bacteroidetes bacterium]|nr:hypothetical protein [Bacteroidota bacterium]
MSVSHHIGLEITEQSFRFVEMQKQDRHTTILRADTIETAHDYASPLLYDLPFDKELARRFITDLASVYHRHAVYAASLSIVLPALLPIVCTIPVDTTLTTLQRREQLEWECRILGGFPPDMPLHILTHELDHTQTAAPVLAVALPQALVHFLTATCEYLTLDLQSIDIDQFVMEQVIRRLYPHETNAEFAVLGLHPTHCSAGRYTGDHYHGCRMRPISYRQQYPAQAVRLLESLPGAGEQTSPQQIYLYGTAAEDRVVEACENILHCSVSRCIPLADTAIPDDIQRVFQETDERLYDAAAAAAILGLP